MLHLVLSFLKGVPSPLVVIFLAGFPILELRGAIPVAIGVYHYPWYTAYALAVLGNMIPAVIVLYGWDSLVSQLERRWPRFHGFMSRYHDSLHTKWQDHIDRYGHWAVAMFIAVPIPLSGVWSGALIAWVFGLHRNKALLAILGGVMVAAALVTFLTAFYV